MIDGKQFEVEYNSWEKRGIVYLDSETLFTTNVKELKLDSGEKVHFALTSLYGRRETNIVALKNAVEMKNDPHFWHLKQSGRMRRVVSRPVWPNRFSIFCTCSGSFTLNS